MGELYLLPLPKETARRVFRGALLSTTPERFSIHALLSGVTGGVAGFILANFFHQLSPLLLVPTFSAIFYLMMLLYPFAKLRARRGRIDMKLPHAITYMQSLCKSMPLFEVIKSIFQEKDLYGEVSEEFGFIVRDVELFGDDLVRAMMNLASETPSESLRELLEGLVIVFESGGDLRNFFESKSEHLREKGRREMEIHLKTIEILCEVYVVLFVAMPIFLIIMLSTMTFLGKTAGFEFYIYLYLVLPVGSMALIYLLDLLNVKEDLSLVRVERKRRYYSPKIVLSSSVPAEKVVDKRAVSDYLLMPFKLMRENYYYSLFLSFPAAMVGLFIRKFLPLAYAESLLALTTILFCLPLLMAFEYRVRFVRRVEKEIPDLLRQILSLKEIGLTLQNVITTLKESKIGVLSREIKVISSDIGWGATVVDALVEFINRIGVASVRRAISLLIKASEVTDNIRDILMITIEDFEYELKLKGERFNTGFAYLVIVYVSFYTFLYTIYSLQSSFFASLAGFSSGMETNSTVYRIAIILALFSGIIAGQLEKGHILSGLKHICIFMTSSILLFEVLLGGGL